MKNILKFMVLAFGFIISSCGDESQNQADDSGLTSLVGFPCQEYGIAIINNDNFVCTPVNLGDRIINVLYRLDGFNKAQKARIQPALRLSMQRYSDFWTGPQPSALEACTLRAKVLNELDPKGSTLSPGLDTKAKKINWAITSLQFGFLFHLDTHQPIVISAFADAGNVEEGLALAHADIGNDRLPTNSDMNFGINSLALNQSAANAVNQFDYSTEAFAGAVIHEMLHRKGYEHKVLGRSVGPLVYEIGNCIADLNSGFSLSAKRTRPARVD